MSSQETVTITNRQRLELFEHYLREARYADLHTLARRFDCSLSTVRRTLNELEALGRVRRHHGGASWVNDETAGPLGYDFITQDNRRIVEKGAIAERIAEMVSPGQTVILDGGTTTYAVARQLTGKRIIAITNSLPIAALFGEIGTIETLVTGGIVYSRLGVLYGPVCEMTLSGMHANLAILSGAGVTAEGIWNNNSFLVSFQQKMMAAADQVVFAIDSSKFGMRALNLATSFREGQTLVTEVEPLPEIRDAMVARGARWVVASVPPYPED